MDCYFRQYWRDTRLRYQGPMKTLSLSIKVDLELFCKMLYIKIIMHNLQFTDA